MSTNIAILVPARLRSTRFPEKLLHDVRGRPVLLWTAERIRAQAPEFPLHFAVDDERFVEVLRDAGFNAILTDAAHQCGTDRIAEANRSLGADFVINVQADEPMVTGSQIRNLAKLIQTGVDMATLGTPLTDEAKYRNPNNVKLVCDNNGHAMFFSRSPIPFFRDTPGGFDAKRSAECPVMIHLGLYAYTADFLQTFSRLPQGKLEQLEKLEMLRAMENGYRIAVGISHDIHVEIDTREQARDFERLVSERDPLA